MPMRVGPIPGSPLDAEELQRQIQAEIMAKLFGGGGQPMFGQGQPMVQQTVAQQPSSDPLVDFLTKRMQQPAPQMEEAPKLSKGKKFGNVLAGLAAALADATAKQSSIMTGASLPANHMQQLLERRQMAEERRKADYQKALQRHEDTTTAAAEELYRIRTAKQAEPAKLDPYQQKEAAVKRMRAMGLNVTPKQEYDFYTGAHGDADPVAQMIKAAQLGGMGVVPEGLSPDLQAIATQAKTFEEKKPSRSASTAEGKVGGMSPTSIMSQLRLNYNNLLIEMGAPLRRTTVTTYDADGYPTQTEVMVPVATPEQRTAAAKRTLNRFPKEVRSYILREMPDWQEQLQPTPAAPKTTEEEFLSR